MTITFTAYGVAKGKGSMKGYVVRDRWGRQKVGMTNDSRGTVVWQNAVAVEALRAAKGARFARGEAVSVQMTFCFIRPVSVKPSRRPFLTVKPDIDKLVRAVLDALTGTVLADDAQVVVLRASKDYCVGPSSVTVAVKSL